MLIFVGILLLKRRPGIFEEMLDKRRLRAQRRASTEGPHLEGENCPWVDLLDIRQDAFGVEILGSGLESRLDLDAWESLQQALAQHYPGQSLGTWCGPAKGDRARTHLEALLDALKRLDPALSQWLASSPQLLSLYQPAESFFPWEWLAAGSRPLWAQRPVLRQFARQGDRPPLPLSKDRTRLLACLDSDGSLTRMKPDLGRLKNVDIKTLEGPAASLSGLASALNGASYDVLLVSCWLDWSPHSRRMGLVLADGVARRERLQEVLLCSAPPVILLGALGTDWAHSPADLGEALEELAELFGRLGSRLVIANLWPFPEWPAQIAELLQGALAGRSLLQSLQRIRLQQAQLSSGPWLGEWSWLCWGYEDLILPGQSTAGTKMSALRPTHVLEVSEGAEPGKRFELMLSRGRQIFLGRPGLKGVDVNLPSEELENRMAAIRKGEGGLLLQNLTEEPERVSVNGLPVSRECRVFSGDRIRLGDQLLVLAELGEKSGVPVPAHGFLQVVRWELPTLPVQDSLPLSAAVTTVGRSTECHLMVPDASVSRVHAALKWRGEVCCLSALGSNPVIVNGVVVDGERELESGDTIILSESVELMYQTR